eukprot:m.444937 g.444937  ORF g.444937 m.444937 type:complete len:58 (-) comp142236_c0_seq1:103-276(-)
MTAVIKPNAGHSYECADLICVSTAEPQLDSEVVDGMAIRSTSVQRPANVGVLANQMI